MLFNVLPYIQSKRIATTRVSKAMNLMRVLAAAIILATPLYSQEVSEKELKVSPVRYELDVVVDYEDQQIHGTARITLYNRSTQPAAEVQLLLYRLMKIKDARDQDGKALLFTQDVVTFEDFQKLQVNHALVSLDQPLSPAGDGHD